MFQHLPKFVFFTGKGGVGKTSLACATALHLADRGKKVLLVSTDPASNVGQVLETRIGNRITPLPERAVSTGWRSIRKKPPPRIASASSARCAAHCPIRQ